MIWFTWAGPKQGTRFGAHETSASPSTALPPAHGLLGLSGTDKALNSPSAVHLNLLSGSNTHSNFTTISRRSGMHGGSQTGFD